MLTENAANLSGGQRQRLALARALLHGGDTIIFDEATSNIDVESETDIMALIAALSQSKTVIVISHRLANVAGADCIYVLENGRIAEHGKHGSLLKRGGPYSLLWNEQLELEQIREVKGVEAV
jgi:ATP-binding cassette subfamily C protein